MMNTEYKRFGQSKRLKAIAYLGTGVLLVAISSSACTAKKKTDDSENKSDSSGSGSGSDKSFGGAKTLKDLNLAGFLAIDLPDSVTGKSGSTGLRLLATKSIEACRIRQQIRDSLSQLTMASQTVCMIQGLPGASFGKKLNIDFSKMDNVEAGGPPPGGAGGPPSGGAGGPPPMLRLTDDPGMPDMPQSMQFWADNSNPDKLQIYFCQDRKLVQHYSIAKVSDDKKVKGSVNLKLSMGDELDLHSFLAFDQVTDPGRTSVTIKERVKAGAPGQSAIFRRMLAMSLADTGVSRVATSESASNGDAPDAVSFSQSSSGAFDANFGSVISVYAEDGTQDGASDSSQAYFDGMGNALSKADHPEQFGPNGRVAVAESSIPKPLRADFKPDDFAPGSWDCQGTSELAFDAPPEAEMNSCQQAFDDISEVNCEQGTDYSEGEAVVISEDEFKDPENFATVPEPAAAD